uniref:Uncharacterized protein n=1 Tax=uncultured bacterium contig00019 TaxID=1181510 RepID=A0A806KIM2_9BACT|nr:hypothetical protein [uncultured bacterium contig00019]
MWMIWLILIVTVPLLGLAAYGEWRNRQVDKYNEWKKQQEEQEKSGIPA